MIASAYTLIHLPRRKKTKKRSRDKKAKTNPGYWSNYLKRKVKHRVAPEVIRKTGKNKFPSLA